MKKQKIKLKPIYAWAVVSKTKPVLNVNEIYDTQDVKVEKDELRVKITIIAK